MKRGHESVVSGWNEWTRSATSLQASGPMLQATKCKRKRKRKKRRGEERSEEEEEEEEVAKE